MFIIPNKYPKINKANMNNLLNNPQKNARQMAGGASGDAVGLSEIQTTFIQCLKIFQILKVWTIH